MKADRWTDTSTIAKEKSEKESIKERRRERQMDGSVFRKESLSQWYVRRQDSHHLLSLIVARIFYARGLTGTGLQTALTDVLVLCQKESRAGDEYMGQYTEQS